jgi:hypothetical protein
LNLHPLPRGFGAKPQSILIGILWSRSGRARGRRFSECQDAGVQLGEVDGDVERLEAQGTLPTQVVDLPAVRLAAEVLDARLGARDDQDVLERGDRAVIGEFALAIGRRG